MREGGVAALMVVVDVVRVQAAEFKFTNKNENKNEPENDHFCKSDGRVRFFKNLSFLSHF